MKRMWSEIRSDHRENGFLCIDAWKTDDGGEQGEVIAHVDMLSGRVIYHDPLARVDEYAQEVIQAAVKEAKAEHPYSVDWMEQMLRSVVDYECMLSNEDGKIRLEGIGFDEEDMAFFGFPPTVN